MKIQDKARVAFASRTVRTLLLLVPVLAARGDTVITATGTNTTLATAQAMNVTPDSHPEHARMLVETYMTLLPEDDTNSKGRISALIKQLSL